MKISPMKPSTVSPGIIYFRAYFFVINAKYCWQHTTDPTYTECPRRNVPDFGRVFLMLQYTDITQNTHIQT